MAPIDKIFSTETMKEMVQCKVAKDLFRNLEEKYGFKPEMLDDMLEAARVKSLCLNLLIMPSELWSFLTKCYFLSGFL